jgi:cytochrome c oxidase cbb3-type subunit 2
MSITSEKSGAVLVVSTAGQINSANAADIESKLAALRRLGVPYSDKEVAAAKAELAGRSEMDALVAYLQALGTALKKAN